MLLSRVNASSAQSLAEVKRQLAEEEELEWVEESTHSGPFVSYSDFIYVGIELEQQM